MHTKLIFHILAPRPLSAKIGGVLLPETFSRKKFPKIFPPKGRLTFCYIFGAKNYILLGELFSIFSVRKIMRVRGTCRSANRGGCPFLPTLYISSRLSFASASGVLHHSTRSKGHRFRSKRGKSEFFFGMLWCFLGIFGDRKGRNTNIFLKSGSGVSCRVLLWWWCPLVAYVPDSGPARSAGGWLWSSGGALPAFCPFSALLVVHCI